MRILMVIGQFAPIVGGAERQCALLARALTARGHVVRVLTVRPERGIPTYEARDGVAVERIAYPVPWIAGRRIGMGFLALPLLAWRAWRLLAVHDVVIAHQALWPAFAAAMAARLRHRPMMVKLGNSGERFDLAILAHAHWYGRIAVRFLAHHVTRFIATSAAVHADLRRAGITDARIAMIPNGVVIPPSIAVRLTANPLRCIFVGSLTPKKDVATLLDALAALRAEVRSRIALTIAGDGPLRRILERRVVAHGLTNTVTFVGNVTNITAHLVQHDAFILPSRTEGLSNAALEAAAEGLPLLLTNIGGNRDLVSETHTGVEGVSCGATGMLVPPGDARALAAALQWVVEHPEERQRMGAAARAHVRTRYAIARVAAQYDALCTVVCRPRIAHILTFLDSQTGGMERQALQTARVMRERGHAALFMTSCHWDRMRREGLRMRGTIDGFPVYRIPFLRGWRRGNAVAYLVGGVILLCILRRRYDVIHAHQLYTSGIVAAVARWFVRRSPLIVKDCAVADIGDVAHLRRLWCGGGTRLLRRVASACIGVSAVAADEMRSIGLPGIVVIPNGVDTVWFHPSSAGERAAARGALRIAPDARMVLFVGRLGPEKQVAVLLDAIAILAVPTFLCIVGDGALRLTLTQHAGARGIAHRTRFVGAVVDVRPYYHAADVFVLASRAEGMSNVLLEAMACGLPVVASDIPSVRSVMPDGMLVPSGDAAAFAHALQAVIEMPDHGITLGRAARERVVAGYAITRVAQQYAALYDELTLPV